MAGQRGNRVGRGSVDCKTWTVIGWHAVARSAHRLLPADAATRSRQRVRCACRCRKSQPSGRSEARSSRAFDDSESTSAAQHARQASIMAGGEKR